MQVLTTPAAGPGPAEWEGDIQKRDNYYYYQGPPQRTASPTISEVPLPAFRTHGLFPFSDGAEGKSHPVNTAIIDLLFLKRNFFVFANTLVCYILKM